MGKEKGREQVFQLGVKFIHNIIDGEFRSNFVSFSWDKSSQDEIIQFFKEKYQDLKTAMPFLRLNEYPRVSLYEERNRLKIHLQGWYNNCSECSILGGMWFNKKSFYDFYICRQGSCGKVKAKDYLIVKYGDEPDKYYTKELLGNFEQGIKWRAIKGLYNKIDEIVSINPIKLLK